MKLIEQQNIRTSSNDKIQCVVEKRNQQWFLQQFNRFQISLQIMIKVHFIRFFAVTLIYYYSDVFLIKSEPHSSQPWNSLLYFLAMMIEIIKFIGDCSLRNLLKNQKTKLLQIHKAKQSSELELNIVLKGATYEDYLSMYSMINIFKYNHRNFSSAFSISRYMHIICTFFIFGWMSCRQLYSDNSILHHVTLFSFLISIYLTSFEVDLYLMQTSEGKMGKFYGKSIQSLTNLTQYQKQDIERNFKNWRKSYLIIQKVGSLELFISLFIDFEFSFLSIVSCLVLFVNVMGYYLDNIIIDGCSNSVSSLKKEQINPYFILHRAMKPIKITYKYFIVIQRLSIFLLCIAFARDSSLNLIKFLVVLLAIVILIANQNRKFDQGHKITLMRIRQIKYQYAADEKQKQCSICLRQILRNQLVNILPCSKQHLFHRDCLVDWTIHKKQCPLCRFSLTDYI